MAELNHQVDSGNVRGEFEPMPGGEYVMAIVNSDIRETRDQTGRYVWFELEVTEGPYAGRKAWDIVNKWNRNPKAAEIAERTMNSIGAACGLAVIRNTEELHYKPMLVKLGVVPANEEKGWDAKNVVKSYKAIGTPAPVAVPAGSPGSPAGASARPATPPWGARK